MIRIAITRAVSRALEHCELTHRPRRPIDFALARRQHAAYEQALREAGCEVRQLPEQTDQPDSVFVEDTAIVLDEVAVITRPGAPSRLGEVESMAVALEGLREIVRIEPPGTLDGGDVLRLDRVLYVGASAQQCRWHRATGTPAGAVRLPRGRGAAAGLPAFEERRDASGARSTANESGLGGRSLLPGMGADCHRPCRAARGEYVARRRRGDLSGFVSTHGGGAAQTG